MDPQYPPDVAPSILSFNPRLIADADDARVRVHHILRPHELVQLMQQLPIPQDMAPWIARIKRLEDRVTILESH